MNPELITDWADHDAALRTILTLATVKLSIFDEDLSMLKLEDPENNAILRRFLASSRRPSLRIVLRNTDPVQKNCPCLMALLREYPENAVVAICPTHLFEQCESLLIADDSHALVRFHHGNVRCKAIIDNPGECLPYVQRLEEIFHEGDERMCATPLGL